MQFRPTWVAAGILNIHTKHRGATNERLRMLTVGRQLLTHANTSTATNHHALVTDDAIDDGALFDYAAIPKDGVANDRAFTDLHIGGQDRAFDMPRGWPPGT